MKSKTNNFEPFPPTKKNGRKYLSNTATNLAQGNEKICGWKREIYELLRVGMTFSKILLIFLTAERW